MSNRLRQYLFDNYDTNATSAYPKIKKDVAIQVDDQDDCDNLSEFCNIFVTVGSRNRFEVELNGAIPVTREMADFAEIYEGVADVRQGKLTMRLTPIQVEALIDFALRLRKSADLGHTVNNPNWHKISARTISSLYRLVRTIKEYRRITNLAVG